MTKTTIILEELDDGWKVTFREDDGLPFFGGVIQTDQPIDALSLALKNLQDMNYD